MTPHIEARKGDYAERVLLPGDPDRAAWIAKTYFDQPRQVNAIRGALGFTGSYLGMPVSVQTTGIGRPSLSIYVHELFTIYGVRTIVRVGSCGSLDERCRAALAGDRPVGRDGFRDRERRCVAASRSRAL